MGWRTLVVNTHSKLSYKNNHLVFKTSEATELIHLSEIDVLLLETTDIIVTTMLLKRLIDAHILVIFCDDKRLPHASLYPYAARHDASKQLAQQIAWSKDAKEEIWTGIIRQKIANQHSYLIQTNFHDQADSVYDLLGQLEIFDPTNREGHAARTYFNALFGTSFSRDLETPINAGLDYGYSLIMSLFAREIASCGCMTQLGLKHSNQFNQWNLASDMMEPFRPLVDSIVYPLRDQPFVRIKRELFRLFTETFPYNGKEMYLSNIVSDYTKKVISALNQDGKDIPVFRI